MTLPNPRALRDNEIAIVRLVAKGLGNAQIVQQLELASSTIEGRLGTVYGLLGLKSTTGRPDALSRVRLACWAHETGLMSGKDTVTLADMPPAPVPQLPAPLMVTVFDLCEAIVADRPRGDIRKIAAEVLRVGGRRRRPNPHRAAPRA